MNSSKRHLRIIFPNFLRYDGKEYVIGGIETYIKNLAVVATRAGFLIDVYQRGDNFDKVVNGIHVVGIKTKKTKKNERELVKYSETEADLSNDILIFATDFGIVKSNYKKVIGIQHGVGWDIPSDKQVSNIYNILTIFKGAFRALVKYKRYKHCNMLICVDYNFPNWYKTQVKYVDFDISVIPNFAHVPRQKIVHNSKKNEVSIIFARRFVTYRGTRLFASAMKQVLSKTSKIIKVTIAGEGPDEEWLKKQFQGYSNVKIIHFNSSESIKIHSKHDIAVVPTLGSEGTSLSLLEAMSAGCAVIASDIGGMTNVVIDGYNGLLISPTEKNLVEALEKLIDSEQLREKLSKKAFETVSEGFTFEKWANKWEKVLGKI